MTVQSQRQTALVTGASGGIGEALAQRFARGGYDLVLVARTEAKLQALGKELTTKFGVRAHALPYDLADPASPPLLVEKLAAQGVAIDILVNNAGFATYGPFAENDLDGELRLLQVNIVTLTHLTRLLLPGMLTRRRGRILNVASTAAFMPGPLMAVYYASKAYVLSFSEALNNELQGSGVNVTALCPGPTSTGFQARAQMEQSRLVRDRKIMDVETVADAGYSGLLRGQAVIIPGLMNRIQAAIPRLLPRSVVPQMVRNAQDRAH
ncbi:SDR family oxidoreductase [Candidatus Gracilibacteria bacterium]|nr:SDR family oxidoreductase [Candidatus Gracilibacteria bacterium]